MSSPASSALTAWLVGVTVLAATVSSSAAEFPTRPIRVVVPYAAGGPVRPTSSGA